MSYPEFPLTSNETFTKPYKKILFGIQELTPFSKLFFSRENINEVQRLIRYNVFLRSGKKHIISNQTETELLIVMRSIYLQYSRFPSNQSEFSSEIKRLNDLIIGSVIPDLVSSINLYVDFRSRESVNPLPLPLGQDTSVTGTSTDRHTLDVLIGNVLN